MGFSVVCIVAALILYTFAVWSERILRVLRPWMVLLFASGFLCDLVGTSLMFLRAAEKFSLTLHAVSGYAALVIMLLHLVWAVLALTKHGKSEVYFTRFSRFAWLFWLAVFMTGIPNVV